METLKVNSLRRECPFTLPRARSYAGSASEPCDASNDAALIDQALTHGILSTVGWVPGSLPDSTRRRVDQVGTTDTTAKTARRVKILEGDARGELIHKLRDANHSLSRTNETLEQEAIRVARFLHDDLGQLLFVLQLSLEKVIKSVDSRLQPEMKRIADLAAEMEKQIRRLSRELPPPMLADLGLVPALKYLASSLQKPWGVRIAVKASVKDRLPQSLENALYRAVQKALVEFAQCPWEKPKEVVLEQRGRMLRCTVRADGVFSARETFRGSTDVAEIRFSEIIERLGSVGGTLKVNVHPEAGTELQMMIPVGDSK